MNMRKFRDRVANTLVNRTRRIASLDMRHGNLHIRRGHSGGENFKTVSSDDNQIRLDVIKKTGELDNAQSNGFSLYDARVALEVEIQLVNIAMAVFSKKLFDMSEL